MGNRLDISTLENEIGSLEKGLSDDGRHLIVMDAEFSSAVNLKWLRKKSPENDISSKSGG